MLSCGVQSFLNVSVCLCGVARLHLGVIIISILFFFSHIFKTMQGLTEAVVFIPTNFKHISPLIERRVIAELRRRHLHLSENTDGRARIGQRTTRPSGSRTPPANCPWHGEGVPGIVGPVTYVFVSG